MAASVRAIPEGAHTITPHLTVSPAGEAIEFYKKAFGAEEICRMASPDGKAVWHAELRIGDSAFYLNDESPQCGSATPKTLKGTTARVHLYVENCDALFQRAVSAGATAAMPPADMFWGDRYGVLTDPFGHVWGIATHKEDLSPDEMQKRMAAMCGGQQ